VAEAALGIEMDERQGCLEENGFSIVDLSPDDVTVRYFRWLPAQGEDAIDGLEPFRVRSFPRSTAAR
jgi:hypothetical protein